MIEDRGRTARQAALFLVVGGASAATDAGGFLLLTHLGVAPWLASALSFCTAFAVNYGGNRDVVFRGRSTPGALRRYTVLVGINLAVSTGLVAGLVAVGTAPFLAKVTSMVVIAAGNFVALRRWVFPGVPGTRPSQVASPPAIRPGAPGPREETSAGQD